MAATAGAEIETTLTATAEPALATVSTVAPTQIARPTRAAQVTAVVIVPASIEATSSAATQSAEVEATLTATAEPALATVSTTAPTEMESPTRDPQETAVVIVPASVEATRVAATTTAEVEATLTAADAPALTAAPTQTVRPPTVAQETAVVSVPTGLEATRMAATANAEVEAALTATVAPALTAVSTTAPTRIELPTRDAQETAVVIVPAGVEATGIAATQRAEVEATLTATAEPALTAAPTQIELPTQVAQETAVVSVPTGTEATSMAATSTAEVEATVTATDAPALTLVSTPAPTRIELPTRDAQETAVVTGPTGVEATSVAATHSAEVEAALTATDTPALTASPTRIELPTRDAQVTAVVIVPTGVEATSMAATLRAEFEATETATVAPALTAAPTAAPTQIELPTRDAQETAVVIVPADIEATGIAATTRAEAEGTLTATAEPALATVSTVTPTQIELPTKDAQETAVVIVPAGVEATRLAPTQRAEAEATVTGTHVPALTATPKVAPTRIARPPTRDVQETAVVIVPAGIEATSLAATASAEVEARITATDAPALTAAPTQIELPTSDAQETAVAIVPAGTEAPSLAATQSAEVEATLTATDAPALTAVSTSAPTQIELPTRDAQETAVVIVPAGVGATRMAATHTAEVEAAETATVAPALTAVSTQIARPTRVAQETAVVTGPAGVEATRLEATQSAEIETTLTATAEPALATVSTPAPTQIELPTRDAQETAVVTGPTGVEATSVAPTHSAEVEATLDATAAPALIAAPTQIARPTSDAQETAAATQTASFEATRMAATTRAEVEATLTATDASALTAAPTQIARPTSDAQETAVVIDPAGVEATGIAATASAEVEATLTATVAPALAAVSTSAPTQIELPTRDAQETAVVTVSAGVEATRSAAPQRAEVEMTMSPASTPGLSAISTPTQTQTALPATAAAEPALPLVSAHIFPTPTAYGEADDQAAESCQPRVDWHPHEAKAGETLLALAIASETTLVDLREGNCLGLASGILPGDIVVLPAPLDTMPTLPEPIFAPPAAGYVVEGCATDSARISQPVPGAAQRGIFAIEGSAIFPAGGGYEIAVKPAWSDSYFTLLANEAASGETLGLLNTEIFGPGVHWLRLALRDAQGELVAGGVCAVPLVFLAP